MTRYSLRIRLLAGAAVAIFVALAAAWLVMTLLFQAQIERRVEQELQRDALQLIAELSVGANGTIQIAAPPTDPRFEAPTSGLYWQVSANGQLQRSRSLWDQALANSPTADALAWRTRFAAGPFGHQLFLLERIVQPAGSNQPVLIQLAIDEEEIRRARAEFGTWMALFLGVLWALLSLAAWFQVQLGLRPLARLQYELAALRHNAAERLSADYPSEVEPLTQAINDLAGAREGDVKRARQRAADLAHGMKTPLAALAAQSRLIREGDGDPRTAADGLDRAIAAAGAAVEAELARARAAASRHARHDAQVAPQAIVQGLVLVLERTDKGMTLDYDLEFPEDLRVRAYFDQNRNRQKDRNEPWDTATLTLTDSARRDFYVFSHDSIPPKMSDITLVDSTALRIKFDRPINPASPLVVSQFVLLNKDSSVRALRALYPSSRFDSLAVIAKKERDDSLAKADTTKATRTARAKADSLRAVVVRDSIAQAQIDAVKASRVTVKREPAPKPARPAPVSDYVLQLVAPLKIGDTVRVHLTGAIALDGTVRKTDSKMVYRPKPAPKDTSKRAGAPGAKPGATSPAASAAGAAKKTAADSSAAKKPIADSTAVKNAAIDSSAVKKAALDSTALKKAVADSLAAKKPAVPPNAVKPPESHTP